MRRFSLWVLLGVAFLALSLHDPQVSAEVGPTESECRPYIEKAIHELKTGDSDGVNSGEADKTDTSIEDTGGEADSGEDPGNKPESGETADNDHDDNDTKEVDDDGSNEDVTAETTDKSEEGPQKADDDDDSKSGEQQDEADDTADDESEEAKEDKSEEEPQKNEADNDDSKSGEQQDRVDDNDDDNKSEGVNKQDDDDDNNSQESVNTAAEDESGESKEGDQTDDESVEKKDDDDNQSEEDAESEKATDSEEDATNETDDVADNDDDDDDDKKSAEDQDEDDSQETEGEAAKSRTKRDVGTPDSKEDDDNDDTKEDDGDSEENDTTKEDDDDEAVKEASPEDDESEEADAKNEDDDSADEDDDKKDGKSDEDDDEDNDTEEDTNEDKGDDDDDDDDDDESSEIIDHPEDDLLLEFEIPDNLRNRKHINELLHLDNESEVKESALDRVADTVLKELKKIYENAIKPLETLYKYRDLSNRHFGDPEIFSKPLVLFMGPWSGGKSTIINYLTDNEYTPNSLRSGAEPSPAYFNILMHGDEPEVLDGTQLAADWTFSGLQKFGQGLEDRLRGLKLPNKLLEKVNIVEIPGILEVRKQVSRLFPFNDACQWFIDRADIIFLVYDPAKLDVGPETEAILDQLKGREYQTRIVLNKADTVKPEELLRVQSALIWNISPLMSSAQPPVMYTTSLWSHPYDQNSPVRLLQAQERAFLRDLRTSVDKRIENKIASARRFAVRVRNHAKMVDCYLTTYYNHKSLFGNKKRISDEIIEHPQNYHIYEGLSTLTNISRYDLPDPEVYRDFFRLNPLYEFKKLSETCTYFRGCPINKLDVSIAYDLPELVGKYKKMAENALSKIDTSEEDVKDKS